MNIKELKQLLSQFDDSLEVMVFTKEENGKVYNTPNSVYACEFPDGKQNVYITYK